MPSTGNLYIFALLRPLDKATFNNIHVFDNKNPCVIEFVAWAM